MSGGDEAAARFAAAEGRSFMARAFAAAGLPETDAEMVAERMLFADLRGIDSHGVVRLPVYIKRLRAGGINRRPTIRIARESPATALVDGDNGMGHLVMGFAARLAIAKAAASGIGWVGARRSNHAGAGATYAMMPLAHDMIGLYLAVANINHMAPWGGIEPLLGTNPIAVAVPTLDEPPVVLDIATTATSFGRIRVAAQNGERLPEGLVIDRTGAPVTDPLKAEEGLLLPMGGYKGYGLSLVLSLLGGALNGTPVGRDSAGIPAADPANTGQAIMALNLASFGPVEEFKRHVDRIVRDLRTSKPLPGGGEVRFPGQQGHRTATERGRSGIPIRPALRAELGKLAAELGIAPLKLQS
ncbi:MAG TPA: Ldh family oxidoreductase [Stellaceae bacterium]|nr:Ldh family oxidoreductase [Stellaceae bacterium]